jgi:thiamine pyrophosphokinase
MSSHHFVRDKQEPALIIANGESCSPSLLNSLLEWNPFIIVLDGAVHRVMELGIKFDVLLGDFDRIGGKLSSITSKYSNIKIVHAENQDKTDLEKGIDYLINEGFDAVNVVWATGRRADHTMTNITNICRFRSQITICILDDYSIITLLPLLPKKFIKWYEKETPISIIPIGKASGISSKNLKYALNNDELILGYRTGSSNEVLETGIVEIEYSNGDLLLMECTDTKKD